MIHIRQPYPFTGSSRTTTLEIPSDIVWLRRGTVVCAVALGLFLAWFSLSAFTHLTWFSIQNLQVRGDTQFHNELTVRANVLPQLTGNYFSLNLRGAQHAFEALPWIRSAVVQRQFPNQLHVELTAHVPVARWNDIQTTTDANADTPADDTESLLNVQGEVFEASGGQIETDSLPALAGPTQAAPKVLALFQTLQNTLQAEHRKVVQLQLNAQGLWQAVLDNQATLELGSGDATDVMTRVHRWLEASPQVTKKYGEHNLQSVDLRYQDGFAIRLAGITTNNSTK